MNSKERILEYLAKNGISKRDFYVATGLSNGFLDKTNNIGADKLEKIISTYKDLDLFYIVTGKHSESNPEEMRSKMRSNVRPNQLILQEPRIEYVPVPVDKDGNENIIFVELKSAAGFGAIVNDEKALSQYPKMALPGFLYRGRKQYVAFEIDGDSMHPTIQHRDIIIGSRIEKPSDIRNGYVYTIVAAGTINTKRLYYSNGDIIDCYSDNDEVYEMYRQDLSEVTAIFRGEGFVRTQFRNWNNDLRRDVKELKRDMAIIKKKIGY